MSSSATQPAEPSLRPPTPWIGITVKHAAEGWLLAHSRDYVDRVRQHGGQPVILAPDGPACLPDGTVFLPDGEGALPPEVLDRLDGILFSGGGDVDPREFGQEPAGADENTIDRRRDRLELGLARAALTTDMPVFGICRGCQLLNVAAGGGMIQHLEGHRSPDGGAVRRHDVALEGGSRLAGIVGGTMLSVNTHHHQGLNAAVLAAGFVAAGLACPEGWLIEACEVPHRTWQIGVQWHPERDYEVGTEHGRIWESYLAACRAFAARAGTRNKFRR